jgi:hypothetical protein
MDNDNSIGDTADQEPATQEDGGVSTKTITCHSISEGSFVSNFWRAHIDNEWTAKGKDDKDNKTEDDVSGVALKENIRLVMSPSSNHHRRGRRSRNKNKNTLAITRFHEDLKTDDLDGTVVVFQAKAEQSISVVLSPWPSMEQPIPIPEKENENTKEEDGSGSTGTGTETGTLPASAAAEHPKDTSVAAAKRYEVVLGANNNTTTTIRRVICGTNTTNSNNDSFVTIPSRVCRGFGGDDDEDDSTNDNDASTSICWTSYWVCLSNSRLYVGMGKVPGKECFGVLEVEEKEDDEQQQQQPIRYVGIGNDAAVQKNKDSIVEVKNLVVTNVPPCLEGHLKTIPPQNDLPIVCLVPAAAAAAASGMDIDEDAETLELKNYMEDYKAECLVRKNRAKKYGTDYKEQSMKEFLPWTMAKRLQLQGKHNLRPAMASPSFSSSGFVAGDIDFLDPKEVSKREARMARFAAATNNGDGTEKETSGETDNNNASIEASMALPPRDGLPVEQAWDKETLLRPIRRDPPAYLWRESPANADTFKTTKTPDPFSMYDESTKAATWITDKLHLSSIDWAAFKQIRNDDLIKHLESYGPIKYIEWLGDVSCNVCFANKASASRALVCLSNELPSPPPVPTNPLPAADAETINEGDLELPTETAGAPAASLPSIDLGCMSWRFGKRPIRKASNDRHGRRGTTARYLLRVATTEDVLIERPSSWPEPPGGFANDRVLGAESDYANANANAKKNHKTKTKKSNPQQQQQNRRGSNSKRKHGQEENNGKNDLKNKNNNNNNKTNNPVDLLNRGLSSSRGGFSVEDMEKERQAKKRQKTS